jgi:hypothetical protein
MRVKWIPDKTGRFRQRPFYTEDELDRICEDEITSFLRERHGTATFPVSTSDLTVMVEQHVADLDNGCDLPAGQDGYTDFFPRERPKVTIASRLQQDYLENRLRTTLTHEYGHVRLHGFLFQLDDDLQHLFTGKPEEVQSRCKHETIEGRASVVDWMEWQAGYACGALLMPKTHLNTTVKNFRQERNIFADIGLSTDAGRALIALVMQNFQVSRDAAVVRLKERKAVVELPSASLFQ